MKITLCQLATGSFGPKVRKILEYKGFDYETVEIDYIEGRGSDAAITSPALRLQNGDGVETIVDFGLIARRLEELRPEPTVFPPQWCGLHVVLARYIDGEVEEIVSRAALPDDFSHLARRDVQRLARFRLVCERKYGAGVGHRMDAEREANFAQLRELLQPFEQTLHRGAFLLGRLGLADFALYGQLHHLSFTGECKIPVEFALLREFYGRVDRISAALEPPVL